MSIVARMIFSAHATAIELCLFDENHHEAARVPLVDRDQHVWHAYLPEVAPGQSYGFRVHGPWDPTAGFRWWPRPMWARPVSSGD